MSYAELTAIRSRTSRTYQDSDNPSRRVWSGGIAPLHYESVIDSGMYDNEINLTPVPVNNAQLDGWTITGNSWNYALGIDKAKGQDGWVGFGGRKGQNWFKFRLLRCGYIRSTNREWQDVGGVPTYSRVNLTGETTSTIVGPNADPVKVRSVAKWRNIWQTPGGGTVDVSWSSYQDGLKEEIILNQVGREWIKANRPPTTPIDQTYFGFMFELDVSDIQKAVISGVQQPWTGDWTDTAPIELRDSVDRLLAMLPLDYVCVQGYKPFTSPPTDKQRLLKRFYKDPDGKNYLAVGLRCDLLDVMSAGALVFDPTINAQISANVNDGNEIALTTWYVNGYSGSSLYFGHLYPEACDIGLRFLSVTIPAGATINSSVIQLYQNYDNNAGSPTGTIRGALGNAAEWSSSVRPSTISNTTASISFAPATGSGVWKVSSSLNTVIQEIVNGSWSSGNAMGIVVLAGSAANGTLRTFSDYILADGNYAKLDITYTAGGGAGWLQRNYWWDNY